MASIISLQTGFLSINTYIVPLCDDFVFVVDPASCALSGDERVIVDYLAKNNKRLAAIFLTHGHFDHITGLRVLKDAYPSVPIAIHQAETQALAGEHSSQIPLLQMWGMDNVCSLIQTLPMADITFYGGETLDNVFSALPDNVKSALSKWKIILTPGHTPGSVCLYNDDEHILISGDTMFYHSWGRTDLEGGSEKDMMNSLRLLINTLPGDTIVYPAHDSYGFKLEDNF